MLQRLVQFLKPPIGVLSTPSEGRTAWPVSIEQQVSPRAPVVMSSLSKAYPELVTLHNR